MIKLIKSFAIRGATKANTKFFGIFNGLLESLSRIGRQFLGFFDGEMLVIATQEIIHETTCAPLPTSKLSTIGE